MDKVIAVLSIFGLGQTAPEPPSLQDLVVECAQQGFTIPECTVLVTFNHQPIKTSRLKGTPDAPQE